jgi:RNA polymerase sigma-70 factor (ECF subfamily)
MTPNRDEFLSEVEPFRGELKAHCYRMSGSLHDAEDLVQDSLIKAWKGLPQFEGRSSLRRWLYTVATRTCLDSLEAKRARILPTALGPPSPPDADPAPPTEDVSWLEPYPDDALRSVERSPEARYSARESVALAFLAALQLLPAKQRAVLLLRDVLGWQASECAELLETSVPAVNSALQRARETLEQRKAEPPKELPDDASLKSLLGRYISAWESADAAALVALLHEDAVLSMPPMAMWMQGAKTISAAVARMVLRPGTAGALKLVPAHLNGQPALAAYGRDGDVFRANALHVLTVENGLVTRLDAFLLPASFERVGLPAVLR